MAERKKEVLLYNPVGEHFTFPLALLAVGSNLNRKDFSVRVIDARMDSKGSRAVIEAAGEADVLGITVLTGSPIRDALKVSREAKLRNPNLTVVWGGWHPSLFAGECLEQEPSIDVTVQGQGEQTFREVLERLPDLEGIPGCAFRQGGKVVVNAPRQLEDLNGFAPSDYGLIPVERYFEVKKRRQLDYISSQGCHFRCAFCADPQVYQRKWTGISPERMGDELEFLWRKYGFTDLNFQDETFFTKAQRVEAVAEQLLSRGIRTTWAATLRADQGTRIGRSILAKCKQSGLRRVLVGVESGSADMLKRLQKDITLEQVFETAESCRDLGIACIFPFIVGLPEESIESVYETLKVARRLRSMDPAFQIQIFFYLPYPGSPIARELERTGRHRLPVRLEEWAEFDYVNSWGPWVDEAMRRRIQKFKFYQRFAWSRPTPLRRPAQLYARWRCDQVVASFRN